ncbi:unnamed protein product [Blepharisma stoltei]|uniref:Uncharacterized protein n=1 Tax=Blepharisma stoltei TaxID=1481888 RepID=A0AAU9IGY5_9CILI|nr:unnamed protein product [Blepharisma stoltei]
MKVYSELIRLIENGEKVKSSAVHLYDKITYLIETIKAELELLNLQKQTLQAAVDHYIDLAQLFQDRNAIINNLLYPRSLTHMNDDLWVLMSTYKDRRAYGPGTEAVSMLLNNQAIFSKFSSPASLIKELVDLDCNDISDSIFYGLLPTINANRNRLIQIGNYSYTEETLFQWLVITFDWVDAMRKYYPFLTSFREIEKLVNQHFLEFSKLEEIKKLIKNKDSELKQLESYELKIIEKFKSD